MKKLFLFALLFPLLLNAQVAFTGKPQYTITAKRLGNVIGEIKVELFPAIAPLAVANFDSLVNMQFYDFTAFHRVVPGFVIQGGDPNSRTGPRSTWGQGDPSQKDIPAEFNAVSHVRGILSAARGTDINSANSQFFICVGSPTYLDGQYTAYGRVTAGMNIVDTIVRAPRDANDNPYDKIEMFIVYTGSNDTVPDSVSLISPVKSTQGIPESQILTWSAVNGAVMYTVEASEDSSFSTLFLQKDVPSNKCTVTTLQPLTTYYWRVRANNGGNISPDSEVFNFTTATGKASLVSPADNATGLPTDLTFQWKSVPGATSYRLQVSRLSNFNSGAIVYNQGGIADTSHLVTGLGPNLRYYWRIQSETSSYPGFFSAIRNFFTANTVGYNSPVAESTCIEQSFPNPAKDFTVIRYRLEKRAPVSLRLYNALGGEIRTLIEEMSDAGEFSFILNTKELPEGIYFYHFRSGSYSDTRKIILIR